MGCLQVVTDVNNKQDVSDFYMDNEKYRRGAYMALVGKPEGRRPLGRPRRRWEDNIKTDL
jgi:hypothetical protein